MKMKSLTLLMAGTFALLSLHDVWADVITTTSGRAIEGTLVQSNATEVLILADYGTVSLPANVVQKIWLDTNKHPTTLSTNSISDHATFPEWKTIISKLANKAWGEKLRQIPATVVTNGILKNVPYISFRCGIDYEVNIYGDLDNPAGVEIGMYRSLLSASYAQENAVAFMAELLSKQSDQNAAKRLNREKDLVRKGGITLEITPPTAEDSYGGWWISAYDEKALDQARASDEELKTISVLNSAIIKTNAEDGGTWTRNDLKYARSSNPAITSLPGPRQNADLFSPDASAYPDVAPQNNHGSVYVHGYYRSNGTYVHPYTRSR